MSGIDVSMEPMLEMFIYESNTLLEQLDEILLESEKADSLSSENIDEIFRIMHTIKGSSAMMGLEAVSTLTHRIEDLFYLIRENPNEIKAHQEVFDIVFQASDYLKAEIELIQNDDYTETDFSELLNRLKKLVALMKTDEAHEPDSTVSTAAPVAVSDETTGDEQQVRVFFEDDCQMENIRAFMLVSQITELCSSITTVPAHPESDSNLSAEIAKNGFIIRFVPAAPLDEIYTVLENSLNIKSYENIAAERKNAVNSRKGAGTAASNADSPSESSAPSSQASSKTGKQSLISVNQSKLDQLMDIVGEIVIAESMVTGNADLKGLQLDGFYKATRQLRKLTDELQDIVMSIRMVPLSGVFQKMNRIVRDMSKKLNKLVDLETLGGETEVDKTIIDSITDPFMHMIRNSMDHAIESPEERKALGKPETGKVTMAAQNVGGEIVITISDDGKGLRTEQLLKKARQNGILTKPENEYTEKEIFSLIMVPGFSTNEAVTEFSGRGVGMDVVRKNIEKVGGSISVDSKKDAGTIFTIKIPLTLAIVDGMMISVGDTVFTLPIISIKQSFKISDEHKIIYGTDGCEIIMVRGQCYPIIRLHNIYGVETEKTALSDGIAILIENEHKVACLFADELIGEQQVVVKPFPSLLNRHNLKDKGMAGCTILGDGSISLILDAHNLLKQY
ncbi:chemotaxis protein CheA [Hydrogenoanaerobacterium sp.]|uniref:chemotaxis protein CheA n=1 Tax=Hydrogenoanaerobacterium sp. TaxID=2953763 RepID=UPI00289A530E|nr:chemotaxis protein CheA [Hydrogenoanaerobacterium sp.]